MGAEIWAVWGALASAAVTLTGHLLLRPKIQAEVRRSEAEVHDRDWSRFQREIQRLDRKITDLEREIEAASKREAELRRQNQKLRSDIAKLKKRADGLEALPKAGPDSAAVEAALERLDFPI